MDKILFFLLGCASFGLLIGYFGAWSVIAWTILIVVVAAIIDSYTRDAE